MLGGVRNSSRNLTDCRMLLLMLAIFAAFGLRLYCLDCQSLWLDETISAHLATMRPTEIVLNRASGWHTPLYFLLLSGWSGMAGLSEFSLRFFSVGTGVLLVPLLYWVCRLVFSDSSTGVLAAFFGAVSAADVIYSQETRMYALLPVGYLVTLGLALAPRGLRRRRDWLWLAIAEIACLYLHVFSAFIVLTINVLLLATRMRDASRRTWRHWLSSRGLVGLSIGLWLLFAWRWGVSSSRLLDSGEGTAAPISLAGFVRMVWAFLQTGLVGIGHLEELSRWMNALAVLAILALPLSLLLEDRRKTALVMVAAFLIPVAGAYPMWIARPRSHPRYMMFLVAPLVIVLARVWTVLSRRPLTWLISAAGCVVTLINAVMGLRLGLLDPSFFRLDARTLASIVSKRAAVHTAVLAPPGDYSLWYYDPAPAELLHWSRGSGVAGDVLRAQDLGAKLVGRPGAFIVRYRGLDWPDSRDQIPFLLEANGRLVERLYADRLDIAFYELEPEWTVAYPRRVLAEVGPLALTGVYSQAVVSSGNAAVVGLRWRLLQPTEADHKVSLRLWDGDEQRAGTDASLLNDEGRATSRWVAGEEVLNYYILPLPSGTPPLSHRLGAALYGDGSRALLRWEAEGQEWLELGWVRLAESANQTPDPYGSWSGVAWRSPNTPEIAAGLWLDGYTVRPESVMPGSVLKVSLRWRAARSGLDHYEPTLVLLEDGDVVAQDPGSLFGRYSTQRWRADEFLIETRQLLFPPTPAALQLAMATGKDLRVVGEIAVDREALLWEPPATAQPICARVVGVAELSGYEWTDDGKLLLYWRALADAPTPASLTVFTHLLTPGGALLAQDDGLPGHGERPTTTWLPGEVIADGHDLAMSESYDGSAYAVVGMYDLATMTRAAAYDCTGRRLPEDGIPLGEVMTDNVP